MSGLNHDFWLVSGKENLNYSWKSYLHKPNAIQIHDDILRYMGDTLKWIPTYNPAKRQPFKGLCTYGVTVINEEGAEAAEKIFLLWAELFSCGPKVLKLTGSYSWQLENDPIKDGYDIIVPNSGGYEKLMINRNLLVDNLRMLASYAHKIRNSDGGYYILHSGI